MCLRAYGHKHLFAQAGRNAFIGIERQHPGAGSKAEAARDEARAGAERQAINAPMQGTAADLIKLAMIAVQAAIDREQRATRMVMQVHDELVFEVPEAELDWVREAVPRLMAGVVELSVPLLAEVGVGDNWDQAH